MPAQRIIRAITLGIGEPHPLAADAFERAARYLRSAQAALEAQGYVVQTTRVATRPLLEELADWPDAELDAYAARLQRMCDAQGLAYCSIGPAPAADPSFDPARLLLLSRLLGPRPALSGAVQLATLARPARYPAALQTARVMRALATYDAGGGAFRFAALACCEPGGPFFPQAYARGSEWWVAFGMQGASIVAEALADVTQGADAAPLAEVESSVRAALTAAAAPVIAALGAHAQAAGYAFGGVDLSPAPMGDDSIAAAIERAGLGRFGEAGTLAVCAALTAAIKGAPLPLCGYSGLMLPVLEDRVIGERAAEGLITVERLLLYSAVCGTGLDTVPLPGETPPERIAALLLDVAALAHRLRKPLSARLFLTPGLGTGELTTFSSPYLTNTRVMPL